MFLDRLVFADLPIITDKLVVTLIVVLFLPRSLASIPAEESVAISAGRKTAALAPEDVLPARILTNSAVTRILFRSHFVEEVIVVAIRSQSLLELCQLLSARAQIGGKTSLDAATCTDVEAFDSACFNSRLVIVSTGTSLPFDSAAIAEFCFTATTATLLAVDMCESSFDDLTACDGIQNSTPQGCRN